MRSVQVMIDRDLAELYSVQTKRINEQVKRNIQRFPPQFCFQLTKAEFSDPLMDRRRIRLYSF
ncbi:MAG TPA: ORF6N domain-containing protein [Paludibacter sp.]